MKTLPGYKSILESEFRKRTEKNPRYSMRAFARTLGMDSRHLSGIFKGAKGLSTETAERVADRLGFPLSERSLFIESVRAENGRGRAERSTALQQVETLLSQGILKKIELEVGQVELVSDWIGIAVHEYLKSHPGVTSTILAKAFREPLARIRKVLQSLTSLRLVEKKEGRYTASEVRVFSSDEIPSPALRSGHRAVLKKAEKSLDEDALHERDFFSIILNVAPADLPAAKRHVRDFLNEFQNRFTRESSNAEVMNLSLQLVPLSKPVKLKSSPKNGASS